MGTDELVAEYPAGGCGAKLRKFRCKVTQSGPAKDAAEKRRATFANHSATALLFPGGTKRGSCLVTPVIAGSDMIALFALLRSSRSKAFNEEMAVQATILGRFFGSLLEAGRSAGEAEEHRQRADNLMSLALELKPSLRLSDFVGRFTARVAHMLQARAAVLALARGARLETLYLQEPKANMPKEIRPQLDAALTHLVAEHPEGLLEGPAEELLGSELTKSYGWQRLAMARLSGSEGELLGVLCLINRESDLEPAERTLLRALAGHASVSLENSRLFSRIEQSKRQWVEDFDAITDWIVVHDPSNHVLRVNRSLAQALDARPSELVGMSMRALSAVASDAGGRLCPFCRGGLAMTEEYVIACGLRAYLVSTSRIGGGLDEGSRTIHVLKDITEQKKFQAQLERERDFNSKILNHTQSIILVLDTAGLVSYANRRCYESGYREPELVGRPLAELVALERRALFAQALDSALKGQLADNLELPMRRSDGKTGQFSVSLSPMRDEQGSVDSIVVVMTDVSDAAVLQAKLRHTEKMAALGQLVSGVAHEVNNPLAAIVGYADLLLENPDVPKTAKEEVGIILSEAERTKGIVQNLLRFARQMPARREPVEVNAVLRQVLQLRAYAFSSQGVDVCERLGDEMPAVMGDSHQLQQVFLNILNNAYDAVREAGRPGRIEIETRLNEQSAEVIFRDNGTGISHPDRIFEPFFTTKDVGKGTGLGLSLCYGIVREHGGEIFCANNSDGPGSTFTVRLPTGEITAERAYAEAHP